MASNDSPTVKALYGQRSTHSKRQYFTARLERAREALQKETRNAVKLVVRAAEKAAEKGDAGPAQWILEHTAATDQDGNEIRPIAPSIDRKQLEAGDSQPRILIGVQIGGLKAQNALESTVSALTVDRQDPAGQLHELSSHDSINVIDVEGQELSSQELQDQQAKQLEPKGG